MFDFTFFFTSFLLGIGLAMDAFSVSVANGINEPCMKMRKSVGISLVFSFFQALMPIIGWVLLHTIAQKFTQFQVYIPWIAFIVLGIIGTKMLVEGIKNKTEDCEARALSFGLLIVQGIATSIDALSVGLTIADYDLLPALVCALIIAIITFILCFIGIRLGKKIGERLSGKAGIIGGAILLFIGTEILVSSLIETYIK